MDELTASSIETTVSTVSATFLFIEQDSVDTSKTTQLESFRLCRSLLSKESYRVETLTEAQAIQINRRPSATVFVCAFFEGRVFDYLVSIRCCIVGPPLILSCMKNGKPLPKSVEPRYSDVLCKAIICCTGIERTEREHMFSLIEFMSGKFKRDLEASCNVLIAADVTAKKYQVACDRNLIVVTSDWLYNIWNTVCETRNVSKSFDPLSPEHCCKFKLPVFSNLIIAVSGVTPEQRQHAEELINRNGGRYRVQMVNGETTHLVSNSTESAKYMASLQWKIPAVNIDWLLDSDRLGYCRNPALYPVQSLNKSGSYSTKTHSLGVLPQKISTPNSAKFPRFSSVVEEGNVSRIAARPAMCDSSVWTDDASRPVTASATVCRIDDTNMSPSVSNRSRSHTLSAIPDKPSPGTPLDQLDLTITTAGDFMRPCRILLHGFSDNQADKLRKIVGACGGQRLMLDSAAAALAQPTHIILADHIDDNQGNIDDATIVQLKSCIKKNAVAVVTARWLSDSFKRGRLMPVEQYNHPLSDKLCPPPQSEENSEITNLSLATLPMNKPKNVELNRLTLMNLEDDFDDDIIVQYMDKTRNGHSVSSTIETITKDKTFEEIPTSINSVKRKSPSALIEKQLAKAIQRTEKAPFCLAGTPANLIKDDKDQFDLELEKKSLKTQCDTPLCTKARARLTCRREQSEDGAREIRENLTKQLSNVLSKNEIKSATPDDNHTGSTVGEQGTLTASPTRSDLSSGNKHKDDGQTTSCVFLFPDLGNSTSDKTVTSSEIIADKKNAAIYSQCDYRVGWDEPCSKQQKANLEPLLKPNSEPTQDINGDVLLEMKLMCNNVVTSLGASYIDSPNFDPNCTHLIVGKPSRNEKLLAGIACGKWILHPSYIEACKNAGKFVNEEEFEWGGPAMEKNFKSLRDELSRKLAAACKRWQNWSAVLLVGSETENGLKNLLLHGGARLCDRNAPPAKITHAFVKESDKQYQVDLKRLKATKIKCYKPEYLAAYLIDEPLNDSTYLI